MKPFSLEQAARWAGGELLRGNGDRYVNRVSTDTRILQPGDLFVALRGERFDGHDYAGEAQGKGASAMVVDKNFTVPGGSESMGLIVVEDTLIALQKIAASYRRELAVRVVGITGSNGKTTSKEMVAAALSARFRVQKTQGNLNNHIGVPLTLLALEEETQWAVVEMGMNHPGEIRPLAEMALPDIAVLTGIGWVHVEAFSSREGIAEEKAELIRALKPSGVAVINADDDLLSGASQWTGARMVRGGFHRDADIRISEVRGDKSGTRFKVSAAGGVELTGMIPLFGAHMAMNASLALAVAQECGVPLEAAVKGLETLVLPGGRMKVLIRKRGWLLDDTYNASPDSIVAGMDSLELLPGSGRKVALLGCMGELGSRRVELHRRVGKEAAERNFGLLAALGPQADDYLQGAREGGMAMENLWNAGGHEELAEFYLERSREDDVILVKGSRSMAMEKVVKMIQE